MSQRRKHISLKVKLDVALLQLGLDPKHVRLDHHPPLALRAWRKAKDGPIVYTPDENDPRYMQWLSTEAHAEKTTGRRGTSKLSKRGGDISEIAKAKRIADFRKRVLEQAHRFDTALAIAKSEKPKHRWPRRKIPTRKR